MDEAFLNLQRAGKNNVDNLIKMMKDKKVIEGNKITEAKVRAMFKDVPDKTHVTLDQFKGVTRLVTFLKLGNEKVRDKSRNRGRGSSSRSRGRSPNTDNDHNDEPTHKFLPKVNERI